MTIWATFLGPFKGLSVNTGSKSTQALVRSQCFLHKVSFYRVFFLWIHDVSPKQNLVYLLKNFKHTHVCTHTDSLLHRAMVPSLLGNRDHFYRREFFCGWRGGWFRDDSSALHLLCTFFLLLLYQLHLRSSGIKSQRLGTSALRGSQECFLLVQTR